MDQAYWEKVTKAINGYYSTTFTSTEVERIFKGAIREALEPIEKRMVEIEVKKRMIAAEPVQHRRDRDIHGRRRFKNF